MVYDPRAVVTVPVKRGVVTLVVLDPDESITEVAAGLGGDCTKADAAWCVAAQPGGRNHARNTAVQRDFHGRIALTPLYDFVPMYLHPDGIARRIRWEGNDNGQPDWVRVVDRVCELAAQAMQTKPGTKKKRKPAIAREALVAGLKAMEPALRQVAAEGDTLGVEPDVLNHIRPHILARADELAALV